ncbi:hypothetical protein [Caldinitratiruptor microaerophilus]|uniref:hypothetical protein n=1 Tax=Caldinitratiruptor microaerophilus TaxID=671077 RepID=UPI002230F46E|nr:hypothetical protein [Caldinitratiruptor microaerophilus]
MMDLERLRRAGELYVWLLVVREAMAILAALIGFGALLWTLAKFWEAARVLVGM